MALIKRGGALFEEETLKDRVDKLNLGQTPTTPLGASMAGASPDSAKMAGTAAQKQNVIKEAVQPQQTLAAAQRLEGPQQTTAQAQQAQERAAQLQRMGTMGQRVQSRINNMIAQSTQNMQMGQISADDQAIAAALGLDPQQAAAQKPQIDDINAKITAYMQNPSEDALLALTSAGLPRNQVYQLTGLLETGQQATGNAIAQAMADELTIADLDVTELGFEDMTQLNALLGQDVSGMTVPELQDAVTQLQAAEFDRAEEIRAQLASLPRGSAQAQILRRELAAMGDVGLKGAEQTVEEAAQAIDMADTVMLGGQEYKVEELLKDENISNLIQDYMDMTPEEREAILPEAQFGELRQWIEENQQALGTLKSEAEGTQAEFQEANEAWAETEAETGLSPELLNSLGEVAGFDFDPDRTVTSAQLEDFKQKFQDTGVGQLAMDPENRILISNLDPASMEMVREWDAPTVKKSFDTAREFQSDPFLQVLAGTTGDGKFATAEEMAAADNMREASTKLQELSLAPEMMKNSEFVSGIQSGAISMDWLDPKYQKGLTDPRIVELVNSGELTAENRDQAFQNLDEKLARWEDVQETAAEFDAAAADDDIDAMIDAVYGYDAPSAEDIAASQKEAEFAAAFNWSGAGAANEAISKQGQITNPEYLKQFSGKGASLMDALNETVPGRPQPPTPLYHLEDRELKNIYSVFSDDGKIDMGDLQKLDTASASAFYNTQKDPGKFGAPPIEDYLDSVVSEFTADRSNPLYKSFHRLLGGFQSPNPGHLRETYDEAMTAFDTLRARVDSFDGLTKKKYKEYLDTLENQVANSFAKQLAKLSMERTQEGLPAGATPEETQQINDDAAKTEYLNYIRATRGESAYRQARDHYDQTGEFLYEDRRYSNA